MKEVHEERVGLDALAGALGVEAAPELFRFLLRRSGAKDVRIDGDALVHPSFLPVELLLRQTLDELRESGARVEACLRCRERFDADRDDGIFADPAALEGFVCRACAEGMDAWTYFHEVLVSR